MLRGNRILQFQFFALQGAQPGRIGHRSFQFGGKAVIKFGMTSDKLVAVGIGHWHTPFLHPAARRPESPAAMKVQHGLAILSMRGAANCRRFGRK
jgi:hypothetical protein